MKAKLVPVSIARLTIGALVNISGITYRATNIFKPATLDGIYDASVIVWLERQPYTANSRMRLEIPLIDISAITLDVWQEEEEEEAAQESHVQYLAAYTAHAALASREEEEAARRIKDATSTLWKRIQAHGMQESLRAAIEAEKRAMPPYYSYGCLLDWQLRRLRQASSALFAGLDTSASNAMINACDCNALAAFVLEESEVSQEIMHSRFMHAQA